MKILTLCALLLTATLATAACPTPEVSLETYTNSQSWIDGTLRIYGHEADDCRARLTTLLRDLRTVIVPGEGSLLVGSEWLRDHAERIDMMLTECP